jgi:hypothetical protein
VPEGQRVNSEFYTYKLFTQTTAYQFYMLLHNLLNHIAAFVFNSFFLVFMKLYIVFACWAFIHLILYTFHAVVLHIQVIYTNVCAEVGINNMYSKTPDLMFPHLLKSQI